MKRSLLLFCFFFLLFLPMMHASVHYNTDSLIHVLDGIISDKANIESKKQQSIQRHLYALRNANSDNARFRELGNLFYRYRTYRLDSAYYYAQQRLTIAKRMGITDSVSVAMMNCADGLKGLGKFSEGLSILKTIPYSKFVRHCYNYYYLYFSITLSLSNIADNEAERQMYKQELRTYRDTINMVNPVGSIGYTINEGEIMKLDGKFRESLNFMLNFMHKHPAEANNNATFCYTLADTYRALGNFDAQEYYLTLSAIIDKRKCNKTYTSLQNLAMLLYKRGDTERAYRYITCAMEDIIDCNARSRLTQVAEYMPIITTAYNKQLEKDRHRSLAFIFIVSSMLVILAGMLFIIFKRNRKLFETRKALDAKNEQLIAMNSSLNCLNLQLSESNKIKEEYIAQLFNLCSGYIDEMEKYRVGLMRKLKTGQIDDLKIELGKSVSTENLRSFFHNFDIIFLDLFPNFIESFNKLLQPDEQIIPKDNELLTPELRIYALVRLGINDSTKIASFLHYSSQTVYNYRLRVRNKSVIPKDQFVEAVQSL
jgi:tetratricopeptide (TPR) repeat protein